MDAKPQDPAVITLEAIKREYTLTLARLQLSNDFPELTGTGMRYPIILPASGQVD